MADEWLAVAARQLDRLVGEAEYRKKRGTIVAIVGARLAGESEETVWEPRRPDTCSRAIYHKKWKHDPLFAEVLTTVERLALEHIEGRALRAKQQAAERLALAAPVAVGVAIKELQADDAGIRLRAAFGILDRAAVETATKGTVTGTVGVQVYIPENGRDEGNSTTDRAARAISE